MNKAPKLNTNTSTNQEEELYAWAEHLNWLEGIEVVSEEKSTESNLKHTITKGIALTIIIALVGKFLSKANFPPFTLSDGAHPFDPVIISIIIGIFLGNFVSLGERFSAGIKYSMNKLLPIGIILLGARLDFRDVLSVGVLGVCMSLVVIGFALFFFLVLLKKVNMSSTLRLLMGVGTAICGGTAIVAIAPILKAEKKEVLLGVATVTFIGLIAMFIMPAIGSYFDMTDRAYGIWAGLTIHQTPQVIASGFAYSEQAGETATIVKLSRVCMLAPIAFLLSFFYQKDTPAEGKKIGLKSFYKLIPSFLLGFMIMALLRTFGLFPDIQMQWPEISALGIGPIDTSIHKIFAICSSFILTISMAAVGLESKWVDLKETSIQPFLYGILVSIMIGVGVFLIV